MVIVLEKDMNSDLLGTKELELPTSGDCTRARYLERAYVGYDIKHTMDLRGTSGLWIFGSPQSNGMRPPDDIVVQEECLLFFS